MIKGEEKLHIKIVIRKVAGENIVKKKNSNCDKTQNFTHYKTQNMTTPKPKL